MEVRAERGGSNQRMRWEIKYPHQTTWFYSEVSGDALKHTYGLDLILEHGVPSPLAGASARRRRITSL